MMHAPSRYAAPRMAVVFALALAAMALSACRGDRPFVGTWRLDVDALPQQTEFLALEGEQRTQAVALARKMLGEVEVEIAPDGRYRQTMAGRTHEGHWVVVSESGNSAVLDLSLERDGQRETRRIVIEVDGNRARMSGANRSTLVLRRE
jgi:hypothetical protein